MTKIKYKNNRRILLRPDIMKEALRRRKLSVSISAIIRDLELNISRPTLDTLMYLGTNVLLGATFNPAWLLTKEQGGDKVQIQPKNYYYKNRFPFGEWKLKTEILSTPKGNNVFQDLFKDK